MAAIVWADVVVFAPSLATFPSLGQDALLAHVNTALSEANFGGEGSPKLNLARVYLAAHMATLSLRGGATGMLASSTASKLSRTYMQLANVNASVYSGTSFGVLYWTLLQTTPARLGTVS